MFCNGLLTSRNYREARGKKLSRSIKDDGKRCVKISCRRCMKLVINNFLPGQFGDALAFCLSFSRPQWLCMLRGSQLLENNDGLMVGRRIVSSSMRFSTEQTVSANRGGNVCTHALIWWHDGWICLRVDFSGDLESKFAGCDWLFEDFLWLLRQTMI